MTETFRVDESMPWFQEAAGWPAEVAKNLAFPELTVGEMLHRSATNHPDRNAAWFLETFITYRELDDLVDRFATALHGQGVHKGDVIAILLPNSFQYVISYFAIARIGAVATGINPTYKPGEILHQLKAVGANGLIVLDALFEASVEPIIARSDIQFIIGTNIADLADGLGFRRFLGKLLGKIPKGTLPPNALSFMQMLRTEPGVPDVKIDPIEDPVTYIMTGGTTGVPKAAVLTHHNVVSNAIQSCAWLYKVPPGAMNIGVLPLFHSFAMTCVMNVSIYVGHWMLLFPQPPGVRELLDTIDRLGPDEGSIYAGAEVMFQQIAEYEGTEGADLTGKFTLCVSGAGPLRRAVQQKFERATGARIAEGYGLTEASPVVSACPFWGNREVGTIGLPFPGTEWKLVDMDDPATELTERGPRHTGEICIAGPQVMQSYLDQPDETAATIRLQDGKRWLLTGDIGWMDEQGRITISDRKKQLIKYRDYLVFPKEIEGILSDHEAIREVAVAGLPHAESGEVIKAWVVLHSSYKGEVSEMQLKAWCKANLTHYKVPKHIELRDELPKSLVGKVLRRELQEADPLYQEAPDE